MIIYLHPQTTKAVSVYRIHKICILQTDVCLHAFLQHIWRCQLVHIRRPRNTFLLCMHASSVCTRVAIRMQSSKESFAVNRLILAQEQLIHFVMVHSLLLPDKQRTPRFPDRSHISCHSRQNLQMLLNFQNLLPADLSYCYIHKALKCNHYFSSSTDDLPVSCTKSRITIPYLWSVPSGLASPASF